MSKMCTLLIFSGDTGRIVCVYCGHTNTENPGALCPLQAFVQGEIERQPTQLSEQGPDPSYSSSPPLLTNPEDTRQTIEPGTTAATAGTSVLHHISPPKKEQENKSQHLSTVGNKGKSKPAMALTTPAVRKKQEEVDETPEGVKVYRRRLAKEEELNDDIVNHPQPADHSNQGHQPGGRRRKKIKKRAKTCAGIKTLPEEPGVATATTTEEIKKETPCDRTSAGLDRLTQSTSVRLPRPTSVQRPRPSHEETFSEPRVNWAAITTHILTLVTVTLRLTVQLYDKALMIAAMAFMVLRLGLDQLTWIIPSMLKLSALLLILVLSVLLKVVLVVYGLLHRFTLKLKILTIFWRLFDLIVFLVLYPVQFVSFYWQVLKFSRIEHKIPDIKVGKADRRKKEINEATRNLLREVDSMDPINQYPSILKQLRKASSDPSIDKDAILSARAWLLVQKTQYWHALNDIAKLNSPSIKDLSRAAVCYASLGLVDKAGEIVDFCRKQEGEPGEELSLAEGRINFFKLLSAAAQASTLEAQTAECIAVSCGTGGTWALMALVEGAERLQLEDVLRSIHSALLTRKFCNAETNYVSGLLGLVSGDYLAAQAHFLKCHAQNYRAQKCLKMASMCQFLDYYLTMCRFWARLGIASRHSRFLNLYERLAPRDNGFCMSKLRLLRARQFCMEGKYNQAWALLTEPTTEDDEHPSLTSSFVLLRARILYQEENYDAAKELCCSIQDDIMVEGRVRRLLANIDFYAKLEARKTHYEVLGLQPSATDSEIRDAFRTLAKMNHPDKFGADHTAKQERIMKRINGAYAVLKNPSTRADYNKSLAFVIRKPQRSSPPASSSSHQQPQDRREQQPRSGREREEVMRMCKEEIGNAIRRWWSKRSGKMRNLSQPTEQQVSNFLKTYIKEKRGHLWNKYRLTEEDLYACLAEMLEI